MFRQAKSAFIWYHLYKFRRTLIIIVLLLCIILFSQWIYSDVVEYLRLREKLEYLDFILPLKWSIIFFNIGVSVYLFLSLFKQEKKEDKKGKEKNSSKQEEPSVKNEKKENKNNKEEKFTPREKMFLNKKKLKNKVDILVENQTSK